MAPAGGWNLEIPESYAPSLYPDPRRCRSSLLFGLILVYLDSVWRGVEIPSRESKRRGVVFLFLLLLVHSAFMIVIVQEDKKTRPSP